MFVQEPLKGLMNMYGGSSVLILQRKKKAFLERQKIILHAACGHL